MDFGQFVLKFDIIANVKLIKSLHKHKVSNALVSIPGRSKDLYILYEKIVKIKKSFFFFHKH